MVGLGSPCYFKFIKNQGQCGHTFIKRENRISSNKIILASSSPYRKILLKRLVSDFDCESPDIDESRNENEHIDQFVLRLAESKAMVVAEKYTTGLIIGSDQALDCDGKILGKPGCFEHAKKQLMFMRGKTVQFHTALCLVNAETKAMASDISFYTVSFRKLAEMEIENYLNQEKPFDCAGSFRSEALGISLFREMNGADPTSLIGLPLIRLCEMLRAQGFPIP